MITLTYYLLVKENEVEITNEEDEHNTTFDYEVSIDLKCIKAFFINEVGHLFFYSWSKEKQNGFIGAIERVYDNDIISSQLLAKNRYFVEFAKDYFANEVLDKYSELQEKEEEK